MDQLKNTNKYIEMSTRIIDKDFLTELKTVKQVNVLCLAPYIFTLKFGLPKMYVGDKLLSPEKLKEEF